MADTREPITEERRYCPEYWFRWGEPELTCCLPMGHEGGHLDVSTREEWAS